MFLNENSVGFAIENQVSVERVVQSGDVDGFKSELVCYLRPDATLLRSWRGKQDVFLQGTDSQKK